jgi:hypothetical protein
MDAPDHDPLHAAIDAKLAQVAAQTPTLPPWYAAWRRLGSESAEEDRLAVYRAVRDAGSVPDEAGLYLVSWQIDALILPDAETSLRDLEDRMEAIKCAHGLEEDDGWPSGGAPPEYEVAHRRFHEAWDALYAAKLEALGENDMARLFRTDRAEFERRSEAGRRFFYGPDLADEAEATAWLDGLLEAVAACVEAESPMGPWGMRFLETDGFWEITVYPTPVELVGGRHDGRRVAPGFSLDLELLRSAFDAVSHFGWDALGLNCPEGPFVWVEGAYQGWEVYVQVLAYPPEDEEPGLHVEAARRPRRRG